MLNEKHRLWSVFLFVGALLAYCIVTLPSIDGGFVLDDWPNLSGLSTIGENRSTWSYVFNGISSTLGRQVSYLTFAVQANHWPDNPAPFKIVNILIHLLNASLLFFLVFFVTKLLDLPRFVSIQLSFFIALIWLMLPIHASTVFYVVQRMTLLSLTFTLLGLISFAYSCVLYQRQHWWQSWFVLTAGMGAGYLFGILSKENTVLMGVFALAIYVLIPADKRNFDRSWKIWFYSCCLLPIAALIVYLLIDNRYLSGYANRDFNLAQRLLTEPVILWDYLKKIVLPSVYSLNLYNDGFPIASNVLDRPYSGVAIIAWVVVGVAAVVLRKPAPYFLFAVIWFLGGHLLESTVIGLELYFEHRNYAPSIGIVIGLVFGFYYFARFVKYQVSETHFQKAKLLGLTGICLYMVWLVIVLRVEAETWGDPQKFAMASIAERPNSLRAYQDAAAYFANNQNFPVSYNLLEEVDRKWQGYPGTLANKLLIHCMAPDSPLPTQEEVLERFESGRFDKSVADTLYDILKTKKQGGCGDISWDNFRDWVEALLQNPKMRSQDQNLVVLIAYSYNAESRFKEAANALTKLGKNKGDLSFMLLQSRFMAMAGDFDEALVLLGELRAKYSDKPNIWLPNQGAVEKLDRMIREQLSDDQ